MKPAAKGSDIVDVDSEWPNNYQISAASVPHLENVYSNLRQKIGRKSGDDTNDLDTNSLMWGIFMSATWDAAVHLAKDYLDNTPNCKAIDRRVTEVAHRSQRNSRSSLNGWYTHPWQRTTLLSDKAVRLSTAKVSVFCDSVLCLGKMHQHPEAIDAWKKKIEWFTETPQYRELDRIGGANEMRVETFPRIHSIGNSRRDSKYGD